jgi:excisionase family DNA binding protein
MSTKRSAAIVSKTQLPSAVFPANHQASVQPRLLRVAEAARYLGATPWFIRSLIWSHSIPFLQLGKRHLIDVRDLDAYVDSQKTERAA